MPSKFSFSPVPKKWWSLKAWAEHNSFDIVHRENSSVLRGEKALIAKTALIPGLKAGVFDHAVFEIKNGAIKSEVLDPTPFLIDSLESLRSTSVPMKKGVQSSLISGISGNLPTKVQTKNASPMTSRVSAMDTDLLRIPAQLFSWKLELARDYLADVWYNIWTGFAQAWGLYSLRIPIPRLNLRIKWLSFCLSTRAKWSMFWLKVRMFGLIRTLKGNLRL